MSVRHELEGELTTDFLSDVVGVHFAGEDEAAIFLPYSGEVLLCSAVAWREVLASRLPVSSAMDVTASPAAVAPIVAGGDELMAALTRLGAETD